ncbi:Re/Si-specific NAD(P)(+) transhydrogenase subunit alpha [Natronospira bacteriovora]|uniref:proton-translocating NAD(P)(+) transhydrogenase n=1 Tax=Natronospira bacteriovora TaxID=3069753 RepID=A0ABU0W794_9GAMM|nr:Re/Si-specific NAD(P)(+) transhydrogenase subunit alpha [Natronospira sp. AB-CW4]MDQ2069788.1 Re/Si-specific NAD(P)(+) transhydrogenase subunit alpha [Natronospira sp. AB-CW4]
MSTLITVPAESREGEKRVAMVPGLAEKLVKAGLRLRIQSGAGDHAGFSDEAYRAIEGVEVSDDHAAIWSQADLVLCVRRPADDDVRRMKKGAGLLGFMAPWQRDDFINSLAGQGVSAFAVELIPRISRAQSMDALSSQAAVAGYKAVLIAAEHLPRFFPMLTTAAGTIRPARALIVGAGVAGLQAIATARRLGARVEAFDVRSAVAEQVESLGARFVDTGVKAEAEGGYARELTEEEKQQQADVLAKHISQADIVITTAAIPGRPAPKIVTEPMVANMKPGAVLVDLAAETGGNCALTRPGEVHREGRATLVGPLDVPGMLAEHASEMYARNLWNFVSPCVSEGTLNWDMEDEVYARSVVTHEGSIRHPAEDKS